MNRRYREWLVVLAPERKDANDPGSWLGIFVLGTTVLAVASFVPTVRDLFELSFWPPFVAFCVACGYGAFFGRLEQRGRLTLEQYGAILLVGAVLLQSFTTMTVAMSTQPGAIFMGALSLTVVAFHAFHHKVSFEYPFGAIPTVIAIAFALAIDHSPDSLAIWAVLAPVMLGFSFILGTFGLRGLRERLKQRALTDAVHAQVLQERTRDRDAVSGQLLKLLQHNHDASNALSSVMLKSQLLAEKADEDELDEARLTELKSLASSVTAGLSRLRGLLDDAREVRLGSQPKVQAVSVGDVIEGAVDDVSPRYPRVALDVQPGVSEETTPLVTLVGGSESLARIVENLLLNACQGDGLQGASTVRVEVHPLPEEGRLSIEVADDGPGFPPEQLASETFAFQTSKPDGLGLGLYTVSNLVRASGGEIVRENRSTGGARVSIQLPVVRA